MCFQYPCWWCTVLNEEEMHFWQCCRHGAVVELFTLIIFPLMPAACRNHRPPPPVLPLMWSAFVVCWGLGSTGEWERGRVGCGGERGGEGNFGNNVTEFVSFLPVPPTSLDVYENKVIVFMCVCVEITVINLWLSLTSLISVQRLVLPICPGFTCKMFFKTLLCEISTKALLLRKEKLKKTLLHLECYFVFFPQKIFSLMGVSLVSI